MIVALIVAGIVLYLAIGFGVGYWLTMSDDDTKQADLHEGVRHMFRFSLFAWPLVLAFLLVSGVGEILDNLAQRIIDRKEGKE